MVRILHFGSREPESVTAEAAKSLFQQASVQAVEHRIRVFFEAARDNLQRAAIDYLTKALKRNDGVDKVSFFRGYLACLSDMESQALKELRDRLEKEG